MKRFKYSLQAVHDVREIRRDHAEIQVATVQSELDQTALLLEAIIEARVRATEEFRSFHNSNKMESSIAAAHSEYVNSLILRERELRERIVEIESRVAVKRQALTERSRDAEVTAKIRERQRMRHQLEAARSEQKNLDEMAVASMSRSKGTSR